MEQQTPSSVRMRDNDNLGHWCVCLCVRAKRHHSLRICGRQLAQVSPVSIINQPQSKGLGTRERNVSGFVLCPRIARKGEPKRGTGPKRVISRELKLSVGMCRGPDARYLGPSRTQTQRRINSICCSRIYTLQHQRQVSHFVFIGHTSNSTTR